MYGDSHVEDKTVVRPSYLQHGDAYTGKTTSLYWDAPCFWQLRLYELQKLLAAGESGIRMVGLCPGFVKTALTQYFQDTEAAGDPDSIALLKHCGGWVEWVFC